MKILFVTQWFEPEPVFKGLDFAKALMSYGHQVEVITGFPNFPGGKLYPGYAVRWLKYENIEGIPVKRVALYPSHDSSVIRRIANYMSFAISAAMIGVWSVNRPDVAYVYHPPGTIVIPAFVVKVLRRIPFVLDIQDLWPDTLSATGMISNRVALKAVDIICRLNYLLADRIVVLSPGFRDILIKRGVPERKVSVIFNWCKETTINASRADVHIFRNVNLDGHFNVVFAGTMGRAQSLSSVLRAAKILEAQQPRVQFIFVGGGIEVPRLKSEAKELRLRNVQFLPACPQSEVGPLLHAADALLVHLRDDPLFSITIPSKTQAYLATGRPILMAVRGNAADLVRSAGAGICVAPEDPQALVEGVTELINLPAEKRREMGENGQRYYYMNISMASAIRRFEVLFRNVARSL